MTPSDRFGVLLYAIGIVAAVVGVIAAASAVIAAALISRNDAIPLALWIPLWPAGAWLIRTGRRMAQESATLQIETDRRPCVLLLRPFARDGSLAEGHWLRQGSLLSLFAGRSSFEQAVAGVMENFGPPIALGRTGERLPPLGFARVYS